MNAKCSNWKNSGLSDDEFHNHMQTTLNEDCEMLTVDHAALNSV